MTADVWHLSKSYWERWSPYCGRPHRKGIDFQTFATEQVNCEACREVARNAWGREYADKQQWGIPA